MSLSKGQDTISGKEGKAFTTTNGIVEEIITLKSYEATMTKAKSDIKTVGNRWVKKKTTGLSGEGTMTVYYMSSKFRKQLAEYSKTGIDTYFDMQVVNEDPASSTGKQTIALLNCNIDSVMAVKLDGDSDDSLDEEIPFTFEGYEILDEFTEVTV